jgi:hypothetical protein
MANIEVSVPELAFVAATRAMAGPVSASLRLTSFVARPADRSAGLFSPSGSSRRCP